MARALVGTVTVFLTLVCAAVVAETPVGRGEGKSPGDLQSPGQALAPQTRSTTEPATRPSTKYPELAGEQKGDWASYEQMHAFFVRRFVKSQGNGLSRMITADDELRGQSLYASGSHWRIGRVDLLSTRDPDQSFAYVSGFDFQGSPLQNSLKRYKHAGLSDEEKAALDKLRQGADVVSMAESKQPEIVGALRMEANCADCHQAKVGDLLGAFRYPLVREPVDQRPGFPR